MGPTNVALVKLFQADERVRDARARLDAATKDVRVQERRVHDLAEKQKLGAAKLMESQSKAGQLELDLKSRDAHIDKLRTQQQNAKNNKEYQTFLIEINTEKVDKNKVEDELLKMMQQVESAQKEQAELTAALGAERSKLATMKVQITDKIASLQGDIDSLLPEREAAAAAVPSKAREVFERLSERFDGEALSAIAKPDRRREEYVCTACNMDLVTDVYNKLHARDEMVFCPSCRRILYIPDDLPPEVAVKTKKEPVPKKQSGIKSAGSSGPSKAAEDPIARVVLKAAGESVQNAVAAGNEPGEFEVSIDGRVLGTFKGQSADNLQRTAQFCLNEAGINAVIQVVEKSEISAPNP
jgi:predicted  nucleic acid-binding Zn-ribbon protein